jgi:hypothetical protein
MKDSQTNSLIAPNVIIETLITLMDFLLFKSQELN